MGFYKGSKVLFYRQSLNQRRCFGHGDCDLTHEVDGNNNFCLPFDFIVGNHHGVFAVEAENFVHRGSCVGGENAL